MVKKGFTNIDRREVAKLKNDDFAAFDQLFGRYSQRIYHFAFGYLKSKEEAEEVVQDVFLKIWEKRYSLREELSFKSYLFTITFNFLKKAFLLSAKKEKAYQALKDELEGLHYNPHDYNQFEEFQNSVTELINQLPERRRQIFRMSRLDGKSNRVIARELSISLKTVENQLSEAKTTLKEQLKNYFPLLLFFVLFFGQ